MNQQSPTTPPLRGDEEQLVAMLQPKTTVTQPKQLSPNRMTLPGEVGPEPSNISKRETQNQNLFDKKENERGHFKPQHQRILGPKNRRPLNLPVPPHRSDENHESVTLRAHRNPANGLLLSVSRQQQSRLAKDVAAAGKDEGRAMGTNRANVTSNVQINRLKQSSTTHPSSLMTVS
ncbi:MAG: hypothetical protein VX635_02705 [Actinomycetota bacterium]|nr:hypothetical protein [Actinomycetota bacterium]